jgi:starch synthase
MAGMRIAMVASECEPFAKTGGLADVVDALARALGDLGHEVDVYLPRYRGLVPPASPAERLVLQLPRPEPAVLAAVHPGESSLTVDLLTAQAEGYRLRLVDHPHSFHRVGYYGENGSDYPDNGARFALAARAALEAIRVEDRPVDILHGHDWQAGPAILGLASRYRCDPVLCGTATLMTIHNSAYHGWVPRDRAWTLDVPAGAGEPDGVDLLREAAARADMVNTVSPTYAAQSLHPEYGAGLDDVLRARGNRFFGIVNGIDPVHWDPTTDRLLPARYSVDDPAGKAACKRDLAARLSIDLEAPPDHGNERPWDGRGAPILAMIGRLDPQKGFDLLSAAAPELVALGARIVLLGTGDERLVEGLRWLAEQRPGRVFILDRFDRDEARRIYAGADVLLMPSRFEPCGQSQMIALRYGTIPLVRRTGGLADTIRDVDADPDGGNGFVFEPPDPADLVGAARRAIAAYRNHARWEALMRRGMRLEFSWARSAPAYVAAYDQAIAAHRGARLLPRH